MVSILKKKGLTVLELLVIVAAFVLILGVLLFLIDRGQGSGRDARRDRDIHAIRTALDLYRLEHEMYPYDGPNRPIIIGDPLEDFLSPKLISGGFMERVPHDPTQDGAFVYVYESLSAGAEYRLRWCYEKTNECKEQGPS